MITPSIIQSCPEIAKDWDYENNTGIDINLVYRTSRQLAHWKCENGHTYQTSVLSRVRSNGCKECNKSLHSEIHLRKQILKSLVSGILKKTNMLLMKCLLKVI